MSSEVDEMVVTRQQRRERVFASAPHVVLLGAGATKACMFDAGGEELGKQAPVMNEIPDAVPEVREQLALAAAEGVKLGGDFEKNYELISERDDLSAIRIALDGAIRRYFGSLILPDVTTIYDHLVLGLREKDVIATFNWDPLLEQARARQVELGYIGDGPEILYLHGNTGVGQCGACGQTQPVGEMCVSCNSALEESPLLFPTAEKDYSQHKAQWTRLESALSEAKMFTIFGYSGPPSDAEAVHVLRLAWGDLSIKYADWIEIVGPPGLSTDQEDMEIDRWREFIPFVSHYVRFSSFYESSIAEYPRRSIERWSDTHIYGRFTEFEPVPERKNRYATHAWYEDLLAYETEATE